MLEEIILTVDDQPGVLAEIGELLGHHGVNIETLAATTFEGRGIVHLIVDDGDDAAEVLTANGFEVVGTRSVLSVTLDDRPGELGAYARRLAGSGIAISSCYVAKRGGGETELIFAVDDVSAAAQV